MVFHGHVSSSGAIAGCKAPVMQNRVAGWVDWQQGSEAERVGPRRSSCGGTSPAGRPGSRADMGRDCCRWRRRFGCSAGTGLAQPGTNSKQPQIAACEPESLPKWAVAPQHCLLLALQAVQDGSLAEALGRLRTQPQIRSAYSRTALLRDHDNAVELQAALLRLKASAHPSQMISQSCRIDAIDFRMPCRAS